jgi:hypothetical protein
LGTLLVANRFWSDAVLPLSAAPGTDVIAHFRPSINGAEGLSCIAACTVFLFTDCRAAANKNNREVI